MKFPVESAGVRALQRWLKKSLPAGTIVTDEWPDPDKPLPGEGSPGAVSVLLAGPAEYEQIDIRATNFEAVDPYTNLYTWRIKALTQPVQLDVWCDDYGKRIAMLAALEAALHAGPAQTLPGVPYASPVRDGPLLPFDPDDGHEGTVDFSFDGPQRIDDNLREREYRAMVRGEMAAILCVKAPSPKLAQVRISTLLTESPKPGRENLTVELSTGNVTVTYT